MTDVFLEEKNVQALVSAVTATRDRLRQSIDGLRRLHNRWHGSNDVSMNLIAQCAALKSNLDGMLDIMNRAISDMHPQLLANLDVLISSCILFVRHLDDLIERLRQSNYDAVDCAIKLRYTMGSRTMERLRKVAQRQTEALSVLVAACQCHAKAQRKILLHKSRQIKKEDITALDMLARSSKWNGGCIKALTQVSRTIQRSKSLLTSKVLRNDSDYILSGEDYENDAAATHSEAIDRALQQEATALHRETKIVLMGSNHSGKQLIMRQMKSLYAGGCYTIKERISYCQEVRSTIRLLIQAIVNLLEDTGVSLTEDITRDFAILLQEVETSSAQHITPAAVKAVENIWTSPVFSKLYIRNFEIHFPLYASYFAREISRISQDDYVPSEADIMRLNQLEGGIKELRFDWDELDIHLFNIGGYIPDHFRKRWFHQLEDTASLIYVVDVSLYDKPHPGLTTTSPSFSSSSSTWLQHDLSTFENILNSATFTKSSIILVLNNFTLFCQKQQHKPLSVFFPDYIPSPTDPHASARQFLIDRFHHLNHRSLPLSSFCVDLDSSDNHALYAALKKSLLRLHHHIPTIQLVGQSTLCPRPRESKAWLDVLATRSFAPKYLLGRRLSVDSKVGGLAHKVE